MSVLNEMNEPVDAFNVFTINKYEYVQLPKGEWRLGTSVFPGTSIDTKIWVSGIHSEWELTSVVKAVIRDMARVVVRGGLCTILDVAQMIYLREQDLKDGRI